jgi:Tfp pilus assembly protein PilV
MKEELVRRPRLSDENGIALVLAVLIMAVLTVTVISMIAFTSSNARDASSKKAGQQAYSLAEAGLSNAFAQLASHYYDASGKPINPGAGATPYDTTWSSSITAPACGSTSCSTWGVTSWTPLGTGGLRKGTVKLWGTGQVPNPAGPNLAPLKRTVTSNVDVIEPPDTPPAPDVWKMVYAGQGPTPGTCDFTLPQGATVKSPLYVVGNLCGLNKGTVESPATLVVGGWVNLGGPNAHIGTQSSPLSNLTVVRSCDGSQNATPACQPNTAGGNIWASPSGFQTAITTPASPPTIDWTSSGVVHFADNANCTPAGVVLTGTFNLTPQTNGSDYTCTTDFGSLSWSQSAEKLTVNGDVYINGNLNVDTKNNVATYTGIGDIYVQNNGTFGQVTFGNNSFLCVSQLSGDCNFNDLPTWDTTKNLLIILARSDVVANNLHFQGGLYSDTKIDLGSGQTETQGPLVSPKVVIPAQQAQSTFPNITTVGGYSPGTPPPPFVLGKPYGGSY